MTKASFFLSALSLLACACSAATSSDAPVDASPPSDASDAGAPEDPGVAALRATVAKRIVGDRTSLCVAVAVLDRAVTRRVVVCADPTKPRDLSGSVALEIGSITKTMTAALIADLVDQGRVSLDQPVERYLPPGTKVPTFEGAPIRMAHLLTHTSGLPPIPSRLQPTDPSDPYARFSDADLLASLGEATLQTPPGTQWEYSNFGYMLLSFIVARLDGRDLEPILRDKLFDPLGMPHAFVATKPGDVVMAQGHRANGTPTNLWSITPKLVGIGGVRATLDAMIRYAEANLGRAGRTSALLAKTHAPVALGASPPADAPEMGMGWIRAPLGGKTILVHNGGTGGFSSFLGIDPTDDRAVIVLSDTAVADTGGVDDLAAHLLDPSIPLLPPRIETPAPADLVASLAGAYRLDGEPVTLVSRSGSLHAVFADGSDVAFRFDSHGDFFAAELDGLLRPITLPNGQRSFTWSFGGQVIEATREAD